MNNHLVLEKISGDEFLLKDGEKSDFEILQRWYAAYQDELLRKPFSVAETKHLVKLISAAIDGPEMGILRIDKWKEICRELSVLLRQHGFEPHGQWCQT